MKLTLYNSLTRKKEIFIPINEDLIGMYVCGPTVYDNPHIGNARSVVAYDVLYRILTHLFGHNKVRYVRNITDVDDKIIIRAKELGIDIRSLTEKTTSDFHHDMKYLNCSSPTIEPKATDNITEMINIISRLIKLNHAYIANNHVYFSVESARDYNILSHRNIDEMFAGARVTIEESKRHPADFVLWKPADKDDDPSSLFDSPWGAGRPGWHIECSAMSHRFLGENFDIHGGGADLIFPHHTNEIAQSTCAFPDSKFANFWVHNGFLTVGGEKMSKSLGNFVTVRDLIEKKIDGDVLRLFFINTHYRKPLDFNEKAVHDAKEMLNYWYRSIENVEVKAKDTLPEEFSAALLDDMNTSLAVKIINDYAKATNKTDNISEKARLASDLLTCANFIGLMSKSIKEWFSANVDEAFITKQIVLRQNAKQNKDWQLADQIRSDLLKAGIILEDKPDGSTSWKNIN